MQSLCCRGNRREAVVPCRGRGIVETRNRKPVRTRAAFQAEWGLRFGPNNRFRVFYQIDQENRHVRIVAIGELCFAKRYGAGTATMITDPVFYQLFQPSPETV